MPMSAGATKPGCQPRSFVVHSARLEARMESLLLPSRTLASPQCAGLPRALRSRNFPRRNLGNGQDKRFSDKRFGFFQR